ECSRSHLPSAMRDGEARRVAPSSPGSARSPTLLTGHLLTDSIRSLARDVRNIWNPWSTDTSDRSEIDRTHHHINRRTAMTAAANVFLGRELKRKFGPLSLLDHKAMAARALELFGELRSETRPQHLVKQMSGGQRQAVAIARTRLSNAKLVMMDEPTAAISVRQVEQVLSLIHRLKEQGVAVMLISHRMP